MKIRFSILLLLFSFNLYSQLPDGAIAPNITFTDIDGNTHTLYDILDEGKSVVFDVMATWCGPCWSYQNTGILENLYEEYGPDGTDEIEIFMVESSTSTNEACLYGPSGCSGGTYGNWTAGILYPIVHITGSNGSNFNNIFNINYFPTLYKVCPNRKIYEVGQSSLSTWENWVTSCNLDATELVNNVICYGQGESLIDLTIEGGYGNITYSWSNGANSQDLIGVPSGDYSCTITEGQGHEIEIGPYTIDGPSSPLFVDIVNQNNVSCAGYNNGYILTSSSGGGNNYSYQWDNGANTQNLNNISGGLYTLSVTDSYGCTETVSTSITEPPLLTLGTQPINENCEQGNGIILLFANGGQGTYLYDIGQGQTSEDVISNLSAGTYSATVTDENGCASFSVAIIENEAGPVAEAGNTGLIACNQEIINLSGSGSSSGNEIIYLWETLDGNIISGANTLDPEVDEVGTYTLNVINVLTGCQTTDEVLVEGDLNAPESEAGEEASLTCIVETVSLDGSNSSQGNEFEYQWLNENGEEISTEIIVDTDQAGTYELVVTDTNNGCTANAFVVVSQDIEEPTANAGDGDVITCATSSVNLDGSASSQGNEFEYQWLNEDNVEISVDINVDVEQAGTFELIVTNTENGCTQSSAVEVTQNIEEPTANAGDGDVITCATSSVNLDGSASSQGNEFEYQWLNEDNEEISVDINVDVEQAGTFELIVTNTENGCTQSSVVEVTQNIEEPTANAGDGDVITCATSSVNLDGSASSQGNEFEYQWLNEANVEISVDLNVDVEQAGTYELIVTNTENGCTQSSAIEVSQNIEEPTANAGDGDVITCATSSVNLDGSASSQGNEFEYEWVNANGNVISNDINVEVDQAGTYELIVTNTENGCVQSSAVEVSQNIEEPTANAGDGDVITCATSSVNLDGSASSQGNEFEYQWLNANGDVISNEVNVEVIQPGTYDLIVTNSENGCTQSSAVEVTQNIEEPTANAGDGDVITCAISSVNLDGSASSEGSQIAYQWLDASGDVISNEINIEVNQPATYVLIVTNFENGCTQSSAVEVTQNIETPLADAGANGQLNCQIPSIELNGSNSSTGPEFEYAWFNSNNTNIGNTIALEVSAAEIYTLIVTNSQNGCTASSETEVTASNDFPEVAVETDGIFNCLNGAVIVNGTGSSEGTNFIYQWLDTSNDEIGTELSVEVYSPGTYTFIVSNTDNGCSASSSIIIEEDVAPPVVDITDPDILDCINTAVNLDASNSSSNGPMVFEWLDSNGNNIGSGESIEVSNAAIYSLLVTNTNNGCYTLAEVQVTASDDIPVATIETTGILTCINETVNVSGINSSSNGLLGYSWLDASQNEVGTTADIEISNPGIYTLIVTDQDNGCSAETSFEVAEDIESPIAQASVNSQLNCNLSELNLDGSGSSSSSNISYSWTTQNGSIAGNPNIQNPLVNTPGVYNLIVTNTTNGCSSAASVEVIQLSEPALSLGSINNVACFEGNDGTASLNITGGLAPYNYNWSNGASELEINNLVGGTYTLIATDAVGCEDQFEITISQPDDLTIQIDETTNNICPNDTQGSIDISVAGGTGGYTYLWSNGMTTADIDNLESGTYSVIITDQAACEKIETVEITAADVISPTIITQDLVLSLDQDGMVFINPNMINNGSSDNCGIASFALDIEAFDCSNIGQNQVTLTLADLSGNITSGTAMINIIDDLAPTINCVENIMSNSCQGIEYALPTTFDNCGTMAPVLIEGLESGSVFPEGETMITYLVEDFSGNMATCSFSITVENTLEISTDNIINEMGTGSNGAIEVSVSGGTPGYVYQWTDINGQVISNEEDLLNVPAGEYTLTVSDLIGCTLSSEVFVVDNIVATTSLDFEKYISITPNPTSGEVTLNIELDKSMTVQVAVLDVAGRVLLDWGAEDLSTKTYQMDLADFPNGIYLTRVILDGEAYVQKLVLVKR